MVGPAPTSHVKVMATATTVARINLINSSGKTPLDLVTESTAKKLLESKGAVSYYNQPGLNGFLVQCHGFFGYGADKRTLLEKQLLLEQSQNTGEKKTLTK